MNNNVNNFEKVAINFKEEFAQKYPEFSGRTFPIDRSSDQKYRNIGNHYATNAFMMAVDNLYDNRDIEPCTDEADAFYQELQGVRWCAQDFIDLGACEYEHNTDKVLELIQSIYDEVSSEDELRDFQLLLGVKGRLWRTLETLCFWIDYDGDNCMLNPWEFYQHLDTFVADKLKR